ncbi:MAG: hypothetical protein LBH42_07900 [Treponema sp.]|jgi:hypothetical protein|nr:hypothetical protein [Treponema sp.]
MKKIIVVLITVLSLSFFGCENRTTGNDPFPGHWIMVNNDRTIPSQNEWSLAAIYFESKKVYLLNNKDEMFNRHIPNYRIGTYSGKDNIIYFNGMNGERNDSWVYSYKIGNNGIMNLTLIPSTFMMMDEMTIKKSGRKGRIIDGVFVDN